MTRTMALVGSDASDQPVRRILVIEHESDSGAAMLGERALAQGFELDVVTPETGIPRSSARYAAVVAMGASPSVNDGDIRWWFEAELALLRHADENRVPILGVCFGAQALAVALGGSVNRASEPEIGWFTVDTSDESLIEAGPWFEWHVDAIVPPPEATVLATTRVCVQAFMIGPHLAVQFHPEVTEVEVGAWSADDGATLAGLGLRGDDLVAETRARSTEARRRAEQLFDRFLVHSGIIVTPG